MNPKDMTKDSYIPSEARMTNEELLRGLPGEAYLRYNKDAIYNEIVRRLNESDTLRKENEELREDKARLDWILFSDRATGDELIEADIIGAGATPELAREMIDGARGRYNAARLAKESEDKK